MSFLQLARHIFVRKKETFPWLSTGGTASFQETPSSGPFGFGPAYLQGSTSVIYLYSL